MDYSIRKRIANDDLTYDEAADLEKTEMEASDSMLVHRVLVPTPDWLRCVLSKSKSDERGKMLDQTLQFERRRHPRTYCSNSVGYTGGTKS